MGIKNPTKWRGFRSAPGKQFLFISLLYILKDMEKLVEDYLGLDDFHDCTIIYVLGDFSQCIISDMTLRDMSYEPLISLQKWLLGSDTLKFN